MRQAYRVFRHRLLYQIFARTRQALSRRLCYNDTITYANNSPSTMQTTPPTKPSKKSKSKKHCYCVRCGKSWTHYKSAPPKRCRYCNSPNWNKLFYIHICHRCGEWWQSNTLKPKTCAICKSHYWNVPFFRTATIANMNKKEYIHRVSQQCDIIDAITPINIPKETLLQLHFYSRKYRALLRNEDKAYQEYCKKCVEENTESIRDRKRYNECKPLMCNTNGKWRKIRQPSQKGKVNYYKSIRFREENFVRLQLTEGLYSRLPSA